MSQPPSQQPPQGGFGSPQDPHQQPQPPQAPPAPPAAPPGHPPAPPAQPPAQPPAAAPGYGYPQTPPGPPGYGYPQAPGRPGPYGAQPGPYGQPNPYGGGGPHPYGTQPPHPGAPTPPPGGGGPFKGRPAAIIGAAVAALLVVGGGTYLALSGDDTDPKQPDAKGSSAAPAPSGSVDEGDGSGDGREANDDLNAGRKAGEAKVEWLTTNDVDLPRNGADVYGPWVVGDTVVKAMYKSVVGYSVADGKKKWEVPFTTEVCTAPVAPADNGTIVVGVNDKAGEKADCTVLQQIDLKTGKAGWKKPVPQGTGFNALSDMTLAISGNTVTAAGSNNAHGFSLADGKHLFGTPDSDCKPFAFAGGPKLIAASSCRTGSYDKIQHEVSEVDPATGKPKWTYKFPANWEVTKVFSVSPLVVSTEEPDKKQWSIVALTDAGKPRSTLDGGKDKFNPKCGGGFVVFGENLQGCTGVAADANTFYMSTEPAQLSNGTNDVVAFDLNTGKPKWRAAAGPERTMTPLRMEGGNVLMYMSGSWDKGGGVATLAPTGGAPKVLLQHPASTAEIESDFYSPKYAYSGGRFFIASGRVSARNDTEEKQTKTMMAFGK
ncbi:PQQ-binding-like beta-propeller repeat protein [Streptomyces sp. NPDC015131]|uniref:outer membrane protein assembly factor BamB family protein n=1 Tax=Streptomyces sp. NPDC015131 TaxID=3364941 RepID=UPI0037008109